jgi:uncharacterized protein
MFPLGSVLFPGVVLPLHVFEPRYRQLTRDCLDGDREFGVVLIERGSEVGGDDVRSDIGTIARIVQAEELPDGRWVLGAVGTRRIEVVRWLDDEPYPRAEVQHLTDPEPGPEHPRLLDAAVGSLRRALALASELGETTIAATIELSDDPLLAGYQASAAAPLGPFDQHRLLGAATPEERVTMLRELLLEATAVLEARLGG